METTFGIDAIDYYVPQLVLPIEKLAIARNIIPAKLEKGLGLKSMALIDVNEDAASMAANALNNLITKNVIDPHTIGRVYLGTESAVDGSKPTATYAIGAVEQKLSKQYGERCFKNCDVVDLTFACVGAVDAMENCLDWVRANPTRKAIVIASDIAKYELGSSGEYTQGAGAVAILICANPSILSINNTFGISMEHVGDFFKPRRVISNNDLNGLSIKEITNSTKEKLELFFEEPVFDGYYSNECYQNRISEALDHFSSQKEIDFLNEWKHIVFHLPYAFQGRRMMFNIWLKWITEKELLPQLEKEIGTIDSMNIKDWTKAASKSSLYTSFVSEKIADGEFASSEIGNMYTASIFMSLISLLRLSYEKKKEITGDTIGFLSYGSGSKSKVFEGIVTKDWKAKIQHLDVFTELENRKVIDFETYEKLHNSSISKSVNKTKNIVLAGISTEENKEGFRYYN
ncbi:hydroxymethylglutaryl-CoA synthase [Ichthyenterobacterium sp. W332]|uniref:Hydroxymethylglutaryl-CoA synthase n=1 Tax=Microcosmobacter mediterraneus TaxID=3075607 RepID=A0ABU2YK59_9FLAO|nr:hydroxymethylglutaryl-CoA synthase [Ichthyenterobacterium sp. W332]MDT0558549.1 hydroxymethylglutaryl-CoA synthase [Ichthyenterobacterium sp. W332]